MVAGFLLFVVGLAVGSFINVVALRYDPDQFLFAKKVVGGRSRCPHCLNTLHSYELIPLVSFMVQRGRCRTCGRGISFQYPLVELISGIFFLAVPFRLHEFFYLRFSASFGVSAGLWIAVIEILLLVALIDMRIRIIPDELNLALFGIGIALSFFTAHSFSGIEGSFLGPYAFLFGFRENILINRVIAFTLPLLLFGFLILVTRGRGMGVGDLKLAGALGVVFGWPDIIVILGVAFVLGSLAGLLAIVSRKKSMKSLIAFGPFIVLAAFLIFFYGETLLRLYFDTLMI